VHFNVTEHPTAEWTARQLLEACALEEGPRYLISGSRPSLWRTIFASGQGIGHPRNGNCAPLAWQNAYAERVIGSIRRECIDHVVVIGERHLRQILSKYVDYYNGRGHTYHWLKTHPSLAVCSCRAMGECTCLASVDCIMNTCGARRETDPTNKWRAQVVTFGRSRVRESRTLGSVGAKAEWLSYPTNSRLCQQLVGLVL